MVKAVARSDRDGTTAAAGYFGARRRRDPASAASRKWPGGLPREVAVSEARRHAARRALRLTPCPSSTYWLRQNRGEINPISCLFSETYWLSRNWGHFLLSRASKLRLTAFVFFNILAKPISRVVSYTYWLDTFWQNWCLCFHQHIGITLNILIFFSVGIFLPLYGPFGAFPRPEETRFLRPILFVRLIIQAAHFAPFRPRLPAARRHKPHFAAG